MAHSGTKITAPVQILGDLQPVLGTSLKDLGQIIAGKNSGGQYLVYINPMSKYKPFAYPATSFASDAARLTALRSRNCGLKFEKYRTPTACLEKAIALGDGGVAVTYNRPTGTISTAPFRLLDFKGYDGSMSVPFRYGIIPQQAYQIHSPSMQLLASTATNIGLEDLVGDSAYPNDYPQLSGYKICLAWRQKNTSGIARAQSVTSQANWLSTIVNDTDYDVCAFLSPVDLTYSDVETARDYYLCPIPLSTFKRFAASGILADGDVVDGGGLLSGTLWCTFGSYTTPQVIVRSENPTNSFTIYSSSHTLTTTHEAFTFSAPPRQLFTQDTAFYLRVYKNGSTYIEQRFYPRFPIL